VREAAPPLGSRCRRLEQGRNSASSIGRRSSGSHARDVSTLRHSTPTLYLAVVLSLC
jgi:hypothetical protein